MAEGQDKVLASRCRQLAEQHEKAFERPWSEAQFRSLLDLGGVRVLERPGGFILIRIVADEAEILTLAVDPAQRRRGVATALVAAAAHASTEAGAAMLHLEVADTNAAARALYEACGFVPTGRRRGYYDLGDGSSADAITMAKSLRAPT